MESLKNVTLNDMVTILPKMYTDKQNNSNTSTVVANVFPKYSRQHLCLNGFCRR